MRRGLTSGARQGRVQQPRPACHLGQLCPVVPCLQHERAITCRPYRLAQKLLLAATWLALTGATPFAFRLIC